VLIGRARIACGGEQRGDGVLEAIDLDEGATDVLGRRARRLPGLEVQAQGRQRRAQLV
jgi:hypothetical protein